MSEAIKAVVVASDMTTAYGRGIEACWQGLLSSKTAIGRLDRFSTKFFQTKNAALVPGLHPNHNESMVMQMLRPLFTKTMNVIPHDAFLILATTVGEIDILEEHVLCGKGNMIESRPLNLLEKVADLCKVKGPGIVISASCASSSTAIARAAGIIQSGERDCVLVVACDCVSEFVVAGFSSLMALDKDIARPFDKNRKGLSVGEAAGFVLLMNQRRAYKENRTINGEIAGWGLSSDANHMTGPSRDGNGLALAIRKALQSAGMSSDAVGCVAAHGTGTVYNDSMEMKAFKSVFKKKPLPTYSIKGGTGHTMGAAGLIEIIVALQSLKESVVPPTVNIQDIDEEALGWVFPESCSFFNPVTVSTNSGFGGVNAALVLKR